MATKPVFASVYHRRVLHICGYTRAGDYLGEASVLTHSCSHPWAKLKLAQHVRTMSF